MYENRSEAGKILAKELIHYHDDNSIVAAIPRGGVEIGYCITEVLDCELTVVISRKLGYLNNPEQAFGAMAEDGSLYLNPRIRGRLSKEEIEAVMQREKKEIKRRINKYRKGEPIPDLTGKTVILADDGIATGSTLMAALEMCVKMKPAKLIVAAPVCGKEMLKTLAARADDVIIPEIPSEYYAVSQVYRQFPAVSDDEVVKMLTGARIRMQLVESLKQAY